jgi:hypothetical protein
MFSSESRPTIATNCFLSTHPSPVTAASIFPPASRGSHLHRFAKSLRQRPKTSADYSSKQRAPSQCLPHFLNAARQHQCGVMIQASTCSSNSQTRSSISYAATRSFRSSSRSRKRVSAPEGLYPLGSAARERRHCSALCSVNGPQQLEDLVAWNGDLCRSQPISPSSHYVAGCLSAACSWRHFRICPRPARPVATGLRVKKAFSRLKPASSALRSVV